MINRSEYSTTGSAVKRCNAEGRKMLDEAGSMGCNSRRLSFLSPPQRLVLLAPDFIERDQSFERLGEMGLILGRDRIRTLFHALVARDQERLGVSELLLLQERSTEQGLGVEGRPVVGLALLAHG